MKVSVTSSSTEREQPALLAWDTEFWGVRIGQAYAPDVDRWAIENTIGCLCLLVSADDPDQIQDAEIRGFRYTDIRVKLERATAAANVAGIRDAVDVDIDRLAEIARGAHRITRFYSDPTFPRERCDDLYAGWIRNSCAGWAAAVLVAGPVGAPTGYVTVHFSDGAASIGLIAVDESCRGCGIGYDLVRAALGRAFDLDAELMTIVTQGRNVSALRVFERAGFRTCQTDVWLHRWYKP